MSVALFDATRTARTIDGGSQAEDLDYPCQHDAIIKSDPCYVTATPSSTVISSSSLLSLTQLPVAETLRTRPQREPAHVSPAN